MYGRSFLFPIIRTDSVNQADSRVKKSDPIPWQFGFENFAQILKLRGCVFMRGRFILKVAESV